MNWTSRALIIVALMWGLSHPANAFVDPPILVPAHPTPGQQLTIDITAGYCDALNDDPSQFQITATGSAIRVVLPDARVSDTEFCINPIIVAPIPIGSYAAGTYTLEAYVTYGETSGPVTEDIGGFTFVVAQPTPVPALNIAGASALGVAVCAMGMVRNFSKRRKK